MRKAGKRKVAGVDGIKNRLLSDMPLSRTDTLRHFLGVKILLKPGEDFGDFFRLAAEVGHGVLNRAVFEIEQRRQFALFQFLHAFGDVML